MCEKSLKLLFFALAILVSFFTEAIEARCNLEPEIEKYIFVEPTSKNGDGSYEAPYRFLKTAISKAEPGTMIVLLPGKYRGPFVVEKSGKCGAPIIIRGLDKKEVVLINKKDYRFPVLTIKGRYITIQDLKINGRFRTTPSYKSYSIRGISIKEAKDITISNVSVSNTLEEAIEIKDSKSIFLEKIAIDNCAMIRYHFGYKKKEGIACIRFGEMRPEDKRKFKRVEVNVLDVLFTGGTVETIGGPGLVIRSDTRDVEVSRNIFRGNRNVPSIVVEGNFITIKENLFLEMEGVAVFVTKSRKTREIDIFNNYIDNPGVPAFKIFAPLTGKLCGNKAVTERIRQLRSVRYRYSELFEACK